MQGYSQQSKTIEQLRFKSAPIIHKKNAVKLDISASGSSGMLEPIPLEAYRIVTSNLPAADLLGGVAATFQTMRTKCLSYHPNGTCRES